MPIEMRDFSAGWIASDDSYNGRKNGFSRMDNCCLDETGALTLVRGTTKLTGSALAASIHTLFSRYIGSDFYRYAALASGAIVRDKNRAGTFGTSVLTGGSTSRADFTTALSNIFMVSGSKYYRDNGSDQIPIGIAAPTAPSVAQYPYFSFIDLQNLSSSQFTNWTCDEGTLVWNNLHNDMQFTPDATTLQATVRTVFATAKDLTDYPADGNWADGKQTLEDLIQFWTSFSDGTQVTSVTINLYTYDPGATSGSSLTSGTYYSFTWNTTDLPCPFLGGDNWNHLKAMIKQFTQNGNTTVSGWNAIKAVTISYVCASVITIQLAEVQEYGSTRASQNGTYEYYTQNVVDSSYEGLSAISAPSTPVLCLYGALKLTLTPPTDATVTGVNIYRREVNTQAEATLLTTVDDDATTYTDGLSDSSLLANSGTTANLFLTSLQSITDAPILTILGLYLGRMLYFTASQIYISDFLNPDAYDSRYVIKYSGNSAETFMWARKVSNSLIYVGTNYDIYQISGTLSVFPDGSLDATIKPIGVQYPPVSQAVACESGVLSYMANDGWRLLGVYGDDSTNISNDLSLLYRGYDRYGFKSISPGYDNTVVSRCALNKGKFITIATLRDSSKVFLVYDVTKKYWYSVTGWTGNCIFSEEDGTLIAGNTAGHVYQLDTPGNYLLDGTKQVITIQTPTFDGGTPRQRKDTFTLKLRANTVGDTISIAVYDGSQTLLHTYTTSVNGEFEVDIDVSAITLFKSYYLIITGTVGYIKLWYCNLEYKDRPEQLTRLRLDPQNFGSSGKKRMFTCPPFVIDTLGNNVTFVPEIDGSLVAAVVSNPTINSSEKTTYVPTFAAEKIATDVGGLLTGGPFEFYGQFVDDWIVEKIPTGRLVDQIGPSEALRLAFLERFRYRCIAEGTSISYAVFIDDVSSYTSSFTTTANVDKTYEIVVPKGLNGTTFRIVLTSASLIHRYSAKVKLRITGGQTEGKWV